MARRSTTTTSFTVEPGRTTPVAVINPTEQTSVIGATIRLDGRGSFSEDGEELEYSWQIVESPLGSQVTELVSVEEDNSVVTLTPDVVGPYVVGLVVNTPYRDSDLATAQVAVQVILVPHNARLVPDGDFIYQTISSFWQLVQDKEAFPVVWSGLIQQYAADLLRLFQVDYAKSIADIQTVYQRRWLSYAPRVDLDPEQHGGVFGFHQSGSSAFTTPGTTLVDALIISAREILLRTGSTSLDAVGSSIRIITTAGSPGNTGTYTINRINNDGSGYFLSALTPFPAPGDESPAAGSDMGLQSTDVVFAPTADFVAATVLVGDIIRVESGVDAGLYNIIGVGTPDGLVSDGHLRLDRAVTSTISGVSYSVFRTVRAIVTQPPSAYTDTVFIPQGEADLSKFDSGTLLGTGTLTSPFEVLVESRHIISDLAGKSIRISSGENGGRSYPISGVNESGTGFVVGSPFLGTFPAEISYELPSVTNISSRLLLLDGVAHAIQSAKLDTTQLPVGEGGTGPVWIVTLGSKTATSKSSNLSWRIAGTLYSDEHDFAELGVSPGDVMWVEVTRPDIGRSAFVPCQIFGAVGNKLAFDIGTFDLDGTEAEGSLSEDEIFSMARDLQVPQVLYNVVTGDQEISLSAKGVADRFNSLAFRRENFNIPVTADVRIDFKFFSVGVRSAYLVRNSKILVDDDLVSVPCLFDYIVPAEVGENSDGDVVVVGKDNTQTVVPRAPLVLLENREYVLDAEDEISGKNLATNGTSSTFVIAGGDLVDRGVVAGDQVSLIRGPLRGAYVIQNVVNSEVLRVVDEFGAPVTDSLSDLEYEITRVATGRYLRLLPGLFTPSSPAADTFWAETSFFDNSDYIEDNFGVLVGVTRDQLDEFGTSQVSYKGVVQGLMYAWANGPTVANAAVGAHLLLGLPVTEVSGIIISIDETFGVGVGRIIIEDVDSQGNRTGLSRIYFFTPSTNNLDAFAGLAINQETNVPYREGDYIDAFQPISRAVLLSDYVNDPEWWQHSGTELRKFHTWQAQVDADVIDSRDLPLVQTFLEGIRPIYTEHELVLVQYLTDDVEFSDTLTFDADLSLYDDPAFSLESTHMIDNYNGGSLMLRLHDLGSFASRTLFEGYDLVSTAGSDVLTSVRGGFTDPLTYINPSFPGAFTALGENLVRSGDVLFIWHGPNIGRFEVYEVVDDNSFKIRELGAGPSTLPAMPPQTFDPTVEMAAATQRFYIERLDQNPLVTGTTLDTTSASDEVVDSSGNFRFNGIAPDDTLVIDAGADRGVYTVIRVDDDNETLQLDRALSATAAGVSYYIDREAIRTNPLLSRTDGVTLAASPLLSTATAGLDLLRIRLGDQINVAAGVDPAITVQVIDVISDTEIYTDHIFNADSGLTFEVVRPLLHYTEKNTDFALEALHPYDDVEMVILRPMSVVVSLSDLSVSASDVTSGATNLVGAGVAAGMRVELGAGDFGMSDSAGVYLIDSVSTFTATIDGVFPTDSAGPLDGDFYDDDPDFSVSGATVTSVSLLDYEAQGILPGDIFRFSGGDFVVGTVSGGTLTLTKTTGVGPASFSGRIVRRSVP